MEKITLILVVLVGTWGGMYNVIQIVKMKNDIRNLVLGIPKQEQLSKENRKLLVTHDFIPLAAGIFIFLLVFSVGLAALPSVYAHKGEPLHWMEKSVCYGASFFCAFALLVDLWASIGECRMMFRKIEQLPEAADPGL